MWANVPKIVGPRGGLGKLRARADVAKWQTQRT